MICSYTLVILGSNTALSISDLLVLLWNDVYDLESRILRVHVMVNEKKVKKKNACPQTSVLPCRILSVFPFRIFLVNRW